MSVRLVTPFTRVDRRSAPIGSGDILTGRWVVLDASGLAVVPGAVRKGLYLALEGNLIHIGGTADFGSSPFASTKSEALPAVLASGALALAYGAFIYEVGPEGCDPTHTFTVGDLVTTDNFGRIVAASSGNEIGKVEAVTTDGGSLVTLLRVRTFGL